MIKTTEEHDAQEGRELGVEQALVVVDRVLGDATPLVWKAAIFYTLWIGLAYTAMTNAAGTAAVQLSAIAYWFGWLFLAMTIVVGVFVAVTSWLDRRRIVGHQNTY
ncbi:hypothetical protein [Halobacterium wangiae]|uniref:hypothetical protein n=1 Tax=Halobacterium wangiae TaxID=2902623 RepID=UPI001E39865A|nr:hypothetical protein [Halobacterium wangiae]